MLSNVCFIGCIASIFVVGTIVYDSIFLLKNSLYKPCLKKLYYRQNNATIGILCENPILVFMFGGAGWLFPFHFGVAKCIQETLQTKNPNIKFVGTSAGGAVASALVCNLDILSVYELCQSWMGHTVSQTSLFQYIKILIQMMYISFHHTRLYLFFQECFYTIKTNPSIFTSIYNRLLLNVTIPSTSHIYRSFFIKRFESFEEFIKSICATCYIPVLGGFKLWKTTETKYCVDGWFSNEFTDIFSTVPEFLNHSTNHCICYVKASTQLSELESDIALWTIEPRISIPYIHFIKPNSRYIQCLLFTLGYMQAQLFMYRLSKSTILKSYIQNSYVILNEQELLNIHLAIKKIQDEIMIKCNFKQELCDAYSKVVQ